jgi:hypothetical protein
VTMTGEVTAVTMTAGHREGGKTDGRIGRESSTELE